MSVFYYSFTNNALSIFYTTLIMVKYDNYLLFFTDWRFRTRTFRFIAQ